MNAQAIEPEVIEIGPQPGPQTMFLSTSADIAIYGGAAGGGKSFGILLEPLRHYDNPEFAAVIFRRNLKQVKNKGGLWDESLKLYSQLAATAREYILEWTFWIDPDTPGARVQFAHLENDSSVFDYQGSQIPLIMFDELTHFSEKQFWYMQSRNRSSSGVAGYVRATCNPDVDSWVRGLIDWWLDTDGYPIPERSGVLRWFIRIDDKIIWADDAETLIRTYGCEPEDALSFTFIPSKLQDNAILMKKDPTYRSKLRALSRVDRLRLEGGNWNIRPSAGEIFQKQWFPVVDAIPSGWIQVMRFWDRAATKPNEKNNDPDWTRGLKMYKYPNGSYLVADIKSIRSTPGQVEALIKTVASQDGWECEIVSQQDPGSAGVSEALNFVTMLPGFVVRTVVISRDKVTRAKPVSAQAEVGNIIVLRAPWNDEFFKELEDFPDYGHDDQVDVLSGAFNELAVGGSAFDNL